jgi:hypothetical protein
LTFWIHSGYILDIFWIYSAYQFKALKPKMTYLRSQQCHQHHVFSAAVRTRSALSDNLLRCQGMTRWQSLAVGGALCGGAQFVVMQSYQNENRHHDEYVNDDGTTGGIKLSEPVLFIFSEICHRLRT